MREFPLADTRELFEQVNENCRLGVRDRIYCRCLKYHGLPWCGELWLDDTLRLGPPSRQYETVLIGPRVIIVDALVDGIGPVDAVSVFGARLNELSAFLSVVMSTSVQVPERGQPGPGLMESPTAPCDSLDTWSLRTPRRCMGEENAAPC